MTDGYIDIIPPHVRDRIARLEAEVKRLTAAIKKALAVQRSDLTHVTYMGDTMESADDGDWCWYDDVQELLREVLGDE